jgi:hypothetical protein
MLLPSHRHTELRTRGSEAYQSVGMIVVFTMSAPLGAQVIVSTHVPGARKLPAASAATEFRQVISCLHDEAANLARPPRRTIEPGVGSQPSAAADAKRCAIAGSGL